MKKKFVIFTLCFTLIFSSLNYKKTYADVGVISLPILATVVSVGVASGLIINDNDTIYNIGKSFYDKYKTNWNEVVTIFNGVVSFNKVLGRVDIGPTFMDYIKEFYNDTFNGDKPTISYCSVPYVGSFVGGSSTDFKKKANKYGIKVDFSDTSFSVGDFLFNYLSKTTSGTNIFYYYEIYYKGTKIVNKHSFQSGTDKYFVTYHLNDTLYLGFSHSTSYSSGSVYNSVISSSGLFDLTTGKYVLDVSGSYEDKEITGVYVPGNLGDFVGGNVISPDDIIDGSDSWVGSSNPSLPVVNNPSISVDASVSFPGADSVPSNPSIPNEGIWPDVTDFIVGLVVPSDTYWTDTWGGLYNNFTNSFPMVDMDGFNDLVTGEKKFPNIDINIMGVVGRVVNGDVVNSIVDWLRPIIAGFMMLCLMLFNYRKIYKLIRNSEPFIGIASGTSDFNTGISEYFKQKERGGK